jgi:hypothetical protein
MLIDSLLMLEQAVFLCSVSHRYNVHIIEFGAAFAPITMGQNFVPSDFATCFDFAARWNRQ